MIINENTQEKNLHQSSTTYQTLQRIGTSEYMVAFSGQAKSYCIGLVDMVNSTRISAGMNEIEWCKFYEIFLNSMAKIISKFGGRVIKNQGDSLLYFFPSTSDGKKIDFINCLDSALAMITDRKEICRILKNEKLPELNYRVSLDFGKVVIMNSNLSSAPDLIGPPVNMCSKINHIAQPNRVVIGGDLYRYIKDIKDYHYSQKKGISIGLKYSYPVYGIMKKYSNQ